MDRADEMVPRSVVDAAYTAVGLALLGFQRVQVLRRDLERIVNQAKERLAAYEPPAPPAASR